MSTEEFLDYLHANPATAQLSDSITELVARRRRSAGRREVAVHPRLVPIPVVVESPARAIRRAS